MKQRRPNFRPAERRGPAPTRVVARYWREGRWLVGDVPGIGATQGRRPSHLRYMVADMYMLVTDHRVTSHQVDLVLIPVPVDDSPDP